MFSLICVWIIGWVNNREAGDLRLYRAHYDVILMKLSHFLHNGFHMVDPHHMRLRCTGPITPFQRCLVAVQRIHVQGGITIQIAPHKIRSCYLKLTRIITIIMVFFPVRRCVRIIHKLKVKHQGEIRIQDGPPIRVLDTLVQHDLSHFWLGKGTLLHWGWDKVNNILQTAILTASS